MKRELIEEKIPSRINKVTVTLLDVALRAVGIGLSTDVIDKIIDLVELIEDKGGYTSLKDISELQEEWEKHYKTIERTKL